MARGLNRAPFVWSVGVIQAAKTWDSPGRYYGYCERRGVKIIELEAYLDTTLKSETVEWHDFEVKAFPDAKGSGLDTDLSLITLRVVDQSISRATGRGKLTLRGSQSDPLHTIPIVSVVDFY